MNPPDPTLVALAVTIAKRYSLSAQLVCAVIEQESTWNTWAIKYEPGFFSKYVAAQYTNNKITVSDAYSRAFSWGLMQVMGQVARELGFKAFLSQLCDPSTGLDLGCRQLKNKLAEAGGDVPKGLLGYNGGKNLGYPGEVMARMVRYAGIDIVTELAKNLQT